MVTTTATEQAVWEALAGVPDPEIPVLSVVDLGIVRSVEVGEGAIRVELLPTFVGCPAIDMMRAGVAERLRPLAGRVEVEVSFAEPWTSDRITPEGRRKLHDSGFSPPARGTTGALLEIGRRAEATCPYCDGADTVLENPFGPTPCRAIFYCRRCRQPFEQFKEV